MNYRNAQDSIPRVLTPSEAEKNYFQVLQQIEMRRLELKRIDVKKTGLFDEIKSLETLACQLQEKAVAS